MAPGHEAKNDQPRTMAPGDEAKNDQPRTMAPGHEAKNDQPRTLAPGHEAKNDQPRTLAPGHKAKDNASSHMRGFGCKLVIIPCVGSGHSLGMLQYHTSGSLARTFGSCVLSFQFIWLVFLFIFLGATAEE